MAKHFIEPIIDKMISLLEAESGGMADKLDVVDAAYDDGITLDDITRVYKGAIKIGTEVPCLVVWPDTNARAEENTNETMQFQPVIVIWAFVKGDSLADAHLRMWRTLEAVFLVIKATDNLGGEKDICQFTGFRYNSPPLEESLEENGYLGVGGIEFTIETEESW